MDKTKRYNVLFLIFLILLSNYADARKSGGGGFSSRGGAGSAARGNPQPAGGHQGGFGGQPRPAPHPGPVGGGGFAGGRPQPAPGAGPGHLGSGTGLGSASRGSSFKTALAGAALGAVGGVLAFEAGKAIIKSMDRPIQHDNKDYYFGQEYVKRGPDDHICSYDFQELMKQTAPPADGATVNATAEENQKALAQIVWACKKWEQCCGMDCCPMPQSVSRTENNKSSALSTFGKVLLMWDIFSRDSNNSYDPSKYENNTVNSNIMPTQQPNPVQPVQAQSYPMHPYPNQPSQQPGVAYPSQPSVPPAYPAYPPAPGYYDSQQQKY
uniref:CX domain-containing protein n=1 Tax=Meloidogyne hapla TaxID=6305 RepID=A0A1I8BL01_MELHA